MSDLFTKPPDWFLEPGRFDRTWNPCRIDYDNLAYEAGPGPWIILKARWDGSPDPSCALPLDASLETLVEALKKLRRVELQDISPDSPWRNKWLPDLFEGKPLAPGVLVFIDSDEYLHRQMRARKPDMEIALPDEGACEPAAMRISEASRPEFRHLNGRTSSKLPRRRPKRPRP